MELISTKLKTYLFICCLLGYFSKIVADPNSNGNIKFAQYVNPLIGTTKKSNGNVVPGATVPFGMIQITPATCILGKNKNTYSYEANKISGFVSTILSGTGGSCLGDGLFMPWCGQVSKSPGEDWYFYSSAFNHSKEKSTAGFYSVALQNDSLQVELTSTTRSGMARFSRIKGDLNVLINPSLNQNMRVYESEIEVINNTTLRANTETGYFWYRNNRYKVYYVIQFNRPFDKVTCWSKNDLILDRNKTKGPNSGMFVTFKQGKSTPVVMKIGLSYVSTENAILNLKSENPQWNFDSVKSRAEASWDNLLSRVKVESDDTSKKQIFYTALYHAFYHPNVFNDVNGDYVGFDKKIHNTEQKYTHYTNFSGWDTYRNQIPLIAMLVPEVANDFALSMVNNGIQAGAMPKWSVANDESGIMIGDPATAAMSTIFAFGIRNYDYKKGYEIMLNQATVPGVKCNNYEVRPDLNQYLDSGYIAEDKHADRGSVSVSLEYNIADYALSQMAHSLGDSINAVKLENQSYSWRRYFNKEKGFLWPVLSDGSFIKEFNPYEKPFSQPEIGFCEANSNVYTLMIPHDFETVLKFIGGKEVLKERIDKYDLKYFRNEPAYLTPWLYNYIGEPWQTQKKVRELVNQFFTADENGIPGNDDLGQMSAWCVSSYLGLFPAIPGTDKLLISSPFFEKIIIDNKRNKKIMISAKNVNNSNFSISSVKLNGKIYDKTFIRWSDLLVQPKIDFDINNRSETNLGQ